MKCIAIALVLAGCTPGSQIETWRLAPADPPNAAQAIAQIAYDFGLKWTPDVYWYGNGLDCWGIGWTVADVGCVGGRSWPSAGESANAYNGIQAIHETSLVHELCHFKVYGETGNADANHTSNCFVTGGFVDQETKKITDLGF